MRTRAPWIVGLVALLVLAGCSGSGTSGTSSPDAGSDAPEDAPSDAPEDAGQCGGLAWQTLACASCTHQSCCSIEELCAAIPSCAPLDVCWLECGTDGGCMGGCGAQYIDAISNFNAILNCQTNFCATECVH